MAFVLVERRRTRTPDKVTPMLPLDVFASRQFSVINVITFLVYGAFGGLLFLLVLQLQVVSGFSPLKAGTALLPVTLLMLALSARSGSPGPAHRPALADHRSASPCSRSAWG